MFFSRVKRAATFLSLPLLTQSSAFAQGAVRVSVNVRGEVGNKALVRLAP